MSELWSDRFRVLQKAAALDTFTARELATVAAVAPGTVRKVLEREAKFFRSEPLPGSGKRGRPAHQYRVDPDQKGDLHKLIGEGQQVLRAGVREGKLVEPTGALLAAEHVLMDEYPQAEAPEGRHALLRLAEADLRADLESVLGARVSALPADGLMPGVSDPRRRAALMLFALAHGTLTGGWQPALWARARSLGHAAAAVGASYRAAVQKWWEWFSPRFVTVPTVVLVSGRRPLLAAGGGRLHACAVRPKTVTVSLVRADDSDPTIDLLAARVRSSLERAPHLVYNEYRWDEPIGPAGEQLRLLVCNSNGAAPVRSRGLELTARFGSQSPLCLLDAGADPDVAGEAYQVQAPYFAFAERMEPAKIAETVVTLSRRTTGASELPLLARNTYVPRPGAAGESG